MPSVSFVCCGDILDIFPINSQYPARIEWFDDTIDAMRSFDLDNQRSIESLSAVKIVPLQIESGEDFSASVLDYLAASTRLVVDEPSRLFELLQKLYTESSGYAVNYGRLPSWKAFALRKEPGS